MSDHKSPKLMPSEATLASMRLAAESASMAAHNVGAQGKRAESLAALAEAIAQATLSRRLLGAVEQAEGRSSASMQALRIAVFDFTHASRSEGATPEAVLITIKSIVNQHKISLLPRYMADWSGNTLHAAISSWCIDAYFTP